MATERRSIARRIGRVRMEDGGWVAAEVRTACGHAVQHRQRRLAFPWQCVRHRVQIVHNAGGCGGALTHVCVVPTPSPCPPSPTRCAHITITGVFYCPSYLHEPWGGTVPPMPGCVWFHAVTSGRCELVVGRRLAVRSSPATSRSSRTAPVTASRPEDRPNHPLIPDLPHEEQSDNYAVLRYGGGRPAHGAGLRRTTPRAPQRPPSPRRPSTRGPRPHRSTHRARRHPRSAGRGGARGREVGSEAVISRLCDILVIQAIRHWMASDDATGSPWLRAMGDPQIGPALAALHAAPAEPWTVAALASRAAMSRSAFAARFRELLGQPVMAYLTELRMQLAVDLLHRSDRTVAEVATAVGYESDASFGRVFKRTPEPRRAEYANSRLDAIRPAERPVAHPRRRSGRR